MLVLGRLALNPLLPISIKICFGCFDCSFAPYIANQLMCGANLNSSRVVLLTIVLSVHAAGLAVERDGVIGDKVDSCGSVIVTS